MNKTTEQLAREAGFSAGNRFSPIVVRHSNGSWVDVSAELERFAALVLELRHAALLAGSEESIGKVKTVCGPNYENGLTAVFVHTDLNSTLKPGDCLYTADQLAAAVLRATLAERERCADVAMRSCISRDDGHRASAAIRAGETK